MLLNKCPNGGIKLAVARTNNTLVLSWPLPYTNTVLESAATLDSMNWQGVTETATTNHGRCEVIMPLGQGPRYFRLRKT